MYTGSLHLHSLIRWVMFALLLVLIYKSFKGRRGGLVFTELDRKMALFLFIFTNIQSIIGGYQWFTGGYGLHVFDSLSFGEVMKNRTFRFFSIEHPIGMLIAIILITVGYSKSKRATTDQGKWAALYWPLFFALIVLLISIPWPFREVGMGRAWFPGM